MFIRADTGLCPDVTIWDADDEIGELTVQGFTDQIQMLQIDTLCDFMVQIVDRRRSDARGAGEVGLRPAKLAKLPGQ